jgi:hypothetical protein
MILGENDFKDGSWTSNGAKNIMLFILAGRKPEMEDLKNDQAGSFQATCGTQGFLTGCKN